MLCLDLNISKNDFGLGNVGGIQPFCSPLLGMGLSVSVTRGGIDSMRRTWATQGCEMVLLGCISDQGQTSSHSSRDLTINLSTLQIVPCLQYSVSLHCPGEGESHPRKSLRCILQSCLDKGSLATPGTSICDCGTLRNLCHRSPCE